MLTQNKKKIIFISLLLCLLIAFSSLGILFNSTYAESEKFIYSGAFDSSYSVGDVVEIPTATVNGEKTSLKITLPDGKTSNSTSLVLRQSGYYKIEYFIKKGSTILKEYKSFVVKGNLFNTDGVVAYEYFENDKYNLSGAKFNISKDASITYADVVDLNKLNGPNDTIFKLYHYPSTIGQADITQFNVILTDAYDETNTVTVRYKQGSEQSTISTITYGDVTFLGDKYVAYERKASGKYHSTGIVGINVDGKPITEANFGVRINDPRYGTSVRASFSGGTETKPDFSKYAWTGLAFDPDTNIVYLVCGNYRQVLADLKNADVFGASFKGFENGMVKVTIVPTVFSKGSWNMVLTEFAGKKLIEDSLFSFESSSVPEINVDFNGYSEDNLPTVKKGNYYKIFDAKGFDLVDGNIDVDVAVYYGYNNVNKMQISVTDGKFLAKHAGTYTIVYTSINSAGTSTVKTFDINCIKSTSPLSISLANEIDYSIEYNAGETIKVFDDYTVNNASGFANFVATAVLKSDENVKFDLNKENNYSFKPIISGEYLIKFAVSDFTENVEDVKELTVVPSTNVHYELNGFFPDYIIKNGRYDLDVINAFLLDTGIPVQEEVSIGVNKDGDIIWLENGDFYVENDYISQDSTLKLVYKPNVNNVNAEDYFVREIPVVDTGLYTKTINMSKYFVSTVGNFTAKMTKNNIQYVLDELENGKASMDFVQTLICNPFKLELAPITEYGPYVAFDSVDVYLTNPANDKEFIKISMKQLADGWYFVINDNNTIKFATSWGTADDYFYVNFKEDSCKVVINESYEFSDVTFYGSDKSVNFPYGVKMRLEFIGPENATGIMLKSVCSQKFSERTNDIVESSIDYAHDNNAGEKLPNEIITIEPFAGYDVLSPGMRTSITVTYTTKDGLTTTNWHSIDGVELSGVDGDKSFKFRVSEYGTYTVTILSYDPMSNRNEKYHSYNIYVVDYTKPIVNITECQSTAKVGDEVKLPKFTVDISEYKWYLSVKAPNSMTEFVNSETAETAPFKFTQKGEYTITLVVYDANYNMTTTVYTVNVK